MGDCSAANAAVSGMSSVKISQSDFTMSPLTRAYSVRPTASDSGFSVFIRLAKRDGFNCCGPSDSALSGSDAPL